MKTSLSLFAICLSLSLFAQTGPGGIGANDGASALRLWYAATDTGEVSQSGRVVSLLDLSGYGDTLFGQGFKQPVYQLGPNGQPTLQFDGGDEMSTPYAGNSNENMSFIVVFRKDVGLEADVVLQHGGRVTLGLDADNTYFNTVGGAENRATAAAADGAWTIHGVTFNATTPTEGLRFFANGDLVTERTYVPENAASITYLGGGTTDTTNFNGEIAEVIKFTKVLNAAERILVDNYLAAKYGLPLATNDVFTMDEAGQGNFDFDVAGIGRVDADNIHADARGRSIVRMLNPADLGDDEFLLWGHDGAGLTSDNDTDVPDGVDSRMRRVWRVSELSTDGTPVDVGNLDLRWDLTDQENFPADKLRLLVDLNDNGSFADDTPLAGATDLGNGQFAFTGVNAIANGRRFSLGLVRAEAALPVELVHFTVEPTGFGGGATVSWETSQEVDNEHFVVERAPENGSWIALQRVAAAGSSALGARYRILDRLPFTGTSYYRLAQVDIDGSTTYSSIVELRMDEPSPEPLRVSPNPATGQVNISGLSRKDQSVHLYDGYGREVSDRVRFRDSGSGSLSFDVAALPSGIYLLSTPGGVTRVVRR